MHDQVRMGGRKKEVDAHGAADAPLTSALAPGAHLESPKPRRLVISPLAEMLHSRDRKKKKEYDTDASFRADSRTTHKNET
jgi:hypothetical protein